MNFIEKLKDRNCLVIGAGITGMAVRKALVGFGAKVDIFDEKKSSQSGVSNTIPDEIDLAVVSPGWRLDHQIIKDLRKSGVRIISEIDFAWEVKNVLAPNQKWIALTGTNGKTTTIKMVESIFNSANIKGKACGNVGETVIEAVLRQEPFDYLALELSSFQIEWSNTAKFEAIALLNISEDHIDWHGTYEKYIEAKLKLSTQSKVVIANKSDSVLATKLKNKEVIWFSLSTPSKGELGLVEGLLVDRAFTDSMDHANEIAELGDVKPSVPHNVSNALAAAALALAIGIDNKDIKTGLSNFTPDHHRMELVLEVNNVKWIDDSKATNPHAAIASLLSNFNIIWIAGGLAKGANMDELVQKCSNRMKSVLLIGEDKELIANTFVKLSKSVSIKKFEKSTDSKQLMLEVVSYAKRIAVPGDTVLLAPACASMDQFASYVERGELFAAAVRELAT
jgi:UDP-N-acetylmuramoylalanine--D-glutamate ligase